MRCVARFSYVSLMKVRTTELSIIQLTLEQRTSGMRSRTTKRSRGSAGLAQQVGPSSSTTSKAISFDTAHFRFPKIQYSFLWVMTSSRRILKVVLRLAQNSPRAISPAWDSPPSYFDVQKCMQVFM
jgi:hypothetical protein